jgi:hypothetical protein
MQLVKTFWQQEGHFKQEFTLNLNLCCDVRGGDLRGEAAIKKIMCSSALSSEENSFLQKKCRLIGFCMKSTIGTNNLQEFIGIVIKDEIPYRPLKDKELLKRFFIESHP